MENIDSQAGPLVYYPGSHRLPPICLAPKPILASMNLPKMAILPIVRNTKIQQMIRAHNLKPKYFLPPERRRAAVAF